MAFAVFCNQRLVSLLASSFLTVGCIFHILAKCDNTLLLLFRKFSILKGKIDRLYIIFLNSKIFFKNSVVRPSEPGLFWFFISFKAVLHSRSVICPSQLFVRFHLT